MDGRCDVDVDIDVDVVDLNCVQPQHPNFTTKISYTSESQVYIQ